MPSRLSLVAALVLGVLGLSSASLAATGPGFAGKWSTLAGGQAQGSLTLTIVSSATGIAQLQSFGGQPCAEPTTYYSGNSNNLGETGVISGCTLAPNHLVGRFRSDTAPQPGHSAYGDGDLTLTDPQNFSGHLTYEGTSYTYTGHAAAAGGSGGTPPPTGSPPPAPPATTPPSTPGSPPSTPPTGGSPTSSTSTGPPSTSPQLAGSPVSKIQASFGGHPAAKGDVVVAEPAPGASVTINSPNPLAANPLATPFTVTDSLGDFPGSTIVAPGELQRKPAGATVACWLLGPDALQVPPSAYGRSIDLKFFAGRLSASQAYTTCAALARSLAADPSAHPAAKAAQTSGGCAARRVGISILAHGGLVTAARLVKVPGAGPLNVKYACVRNADASLKISVSGPRKGSLLGSLGTQLRLGVVRAADAHARTAKIRFSFGAPRPSR